jgi:hypothetical protein
MLTATVVSSSASLTVPIGAKRAIAALMTRMSTRPKAPSAASNSAATDA